VFLDDIGLINLVDIGLSSFSDYVKVSQKLSSVREVRNNDAKLTLETKSVDG